MLTNTFRWNENSEMRKGSSLIQGREEKKTMRMPHETEDAKWGFDTVWWHENLTGDKIKPPVSGWLSIALKQNLQINVALGILNSHELEVCTGDLFRWMHCGPTLLLHKTPTHR